MIFNKLYKQFFKSKLLDKILLFMILSLILSKSLNYIFCNKREGLEGFNPVYNYLESNNKIYNDMYCRLYDKLVYNDDKNGYEISRIIEGTNPDKNDLVLDIGSGTGHHVGELTLNNIPAIGIDISPAMVNIAMENYPNSHFINADGLDPNILDDEMVSHITCLYFTIYYFQDKNIFFENCYNWLIPGGYLIIHLVDKYKFDKIVPSGEAMDAKRLESEVLFDDIEYTSKLEINDKSDNALFNEKIKKDEIVIENQHQLFIEPQKKILNIAKENGFIIENMYDMVACNYDNQYLYILKKPL